MLKLMPLSLPILTFHAIDHSPAVISFSPKFFERGMRFLHQRGYRTLNLVDVAAYIRSGLSLPDRSIVLTFDDGLRGGVLGRCSDCQATQQCRRCQLIPQLHDF